MGSCSPGAVQWGAGALCAVLKSFCAPQPKQPVQPGWIFRWPGLLSPGEQCEPAQLLCFCPQLLAWQLCPEDVYHKGILKLFDSSADLLVGTWVLFGLCIVVVLSWPCCWPLCPGAMAELGRHLLPFPAQLVTKELILCWSHADPQAEPVLGMPVPSRAWTCPLASDWCPLS